MDRMRRRFTPRGVGSGEAFLGIGLLLIAYALPPDLFPKLIAAVLGITFLILGIWTISRAEAPVAAPMVDTRPLDRPVVQSELSGVRSQNDPPDGPQVVVGPGDIAPATLIEYFVKHSSLEANKLIEVFKGQRIKRLTGVVVDILGSGGPEDRPAVMLYLDREYDYVLAYFGTEWVAQVTRQPGAPITLSGAIKEASRHYVILDDCELVEP